MMTGKRSKVAPEQRFWAKVDKNGPVPDCRPELGPCWLWTACTGKGYGRFSTGQGREKANAARWLYETTFGPLPPGYEPDHLCRVRLCVRLTHIEAVTQAENMRRMNAAHPGPRGRALVEIATTSCPLGHLYDEANTYVNKRGSRICRACHRDKERARQHRLHLNR